MTKFTDEMMDQPDALLKTLEYYIHPNQGAEILSKVQKLIRKGKFSNIIYTGMGSSYFNSLISVNLLNSRGFHAEVRDSGEMLNPLF